MSDYIPILKWICRVIPKRRLFRLLLHFLPTMIFFRLQMWLYEQILTSQTCTKDEIYRLLSILSHKYVPTSDRSAIECVCRIVHRSMMTCNSSDTFCYALGLYTPFVSRIIVSWLPFVQHVSPCFSLVDDYLARASASDICEILILIGSEEQWEKSETFEKERALGLTHRMGETWVNLPVNTIKNYRLKYKSAWQHVIKTSIDILKNCSKISRNYIPLDLYPLDLHLLDLHLLDLHPLELHSFRLAFKTLRTLLIRQVFPLDYVFNFHPSWFVTDLKLDFIWFAFVKLDVLHLPLHSVHYLMVKATKVINTVPSTQFCYLNDQERNKVVQDCMNVACHLFSQNFGYRDDIDLDMLILMDFLSSEAAPSCTPHINHLSPESQTYIYLKASNFLQSSNETARISLSMVYGTYPDNQWFKDIPSWALFM